jgi:hypothetical protein
LVKRQELKTIILKHKNMKKKELKSMVADAYKLQSKTTGTQVSFQIYANGNYILDTEEDNVIGIVDNEQEAIESCEAINSGEFSEDGTKSDCYYKPILIDEETGERITSDTIKNYLKKGECAKSKRTQGTFFIDAGDTISELLLRVEIKEDGNTELFDICDFSPDETGNVKANAAFICEAVNNYDKLKEDNERLKRIVTDFLEICKWIPKETFTNNGQAIFQNLLTAASEVIKL